MQFFWDTVYMQEPVNSRVVKFCVVLTSVTNSHDYFGLYVLTGSTSVYMSMFTLTAIWGIGKTTCSFEHYLVVWMFWDTNDSHWRSSAVLVNPSIRRHGCGITVSSVVVVVLLLTHSGKLKRYCDVLYVAVSYQLFSDAVPLHSIFDKHWFVGIYH